MAFNHLKGVPRKPQNVLSTNLEVVNLSPSTDFVHSPLNMGLDLVKLCVFLIMILDICPEGYVTLYGRAFSQKGCSKALRIIVIVKPV